MDDKVLKIQVVVDESGEGARRLDDLDDQVNKVDKSATDARVPVDRLGSSLSKTGHSADDLGDAVRGSNDEFAAGIPLVGGMTTGMVAAGAAAAGAVIGIAALAAVIQDTTSYYIEQSGVLEINKSAMDELIETWNRARYELGRAIVGEDGDFRSWIEFAKIGLADIASRIIANTELARKFLQFHGILDMDGADTRLRNADGSGTEFGNQQLGKYIVDGIDEETVAREEAKLELARYNAELANTKIHTDILLKKAKEYIQVQKELAEELRRVETAAKAAFDDEISDAFMGNLRDMKGVTQGLRDDFASMVLSGNALKEFQINEEFTRARENVDQRAENAQAMIAKLEAQRQLQLLMLRKDSEGLTDSLQQDILIFRETYADVLGGLPEFLQGVVPEVLGASGEIRDGMSEDFAAVEAAASQTFQSIVIQAKSSAELLRESLMHDYDASINERRGGIAGFYGQFQRQQAADKRRLAGEARYREAQIGFSRGGLVPGDGSTLYANMGMFVPRGSDTVPAMLTPGEGVINTRGMSALDRINSGSVGGITINGPLVDARGAQFTDDAALTVLSDRVQQKLNTLMTRVN